MTLREKQTLPLKWFWYGNNRTTIHLKDFLNYLKTQTRLQIPHQTSSDETSLVLGRRKLKNLARMKGSTHQRCIWGMGMEEKPKISIFPVTNSEKNLLLGTPTTLIPIVVLPLKNFPLPRLANFFPSLPLNLLNLSMLILSLNFPNKTLYKWTLSSLKLATSEPNKPSHISSFITSCHNKYVIRRKRMREFVFCDDR